MQNIPYFTIICEKKEDLLIREIDRLGEMLALIAKKLGLMETEKLSDRGLESFIDILFHSDLEESLKASLLNEATAFLDGKGYHSFLLHSLDSNGVV